jgi:hypothetical protein
MRATFKIGRVATGSDCRSTNPNPNYGREVVGEGECLEERWWEKEVVWMKRVNAGGVGSAGDEGMEGRRRSRRRSEKEVGGTRAVSRRGGTWARELCGTMHE